MIRGFEKIKKTIWSCKTIEQLEACKNMIWAYIVNYDPDTIYIDDLWTYFSIHYKYLLKNDDNRQL